MARLGRHHGRIVTSSSPRSGDLRPGIHRGLYSADRLRAGSVAVTLQRMWLPVGLLLGLFVRVLAHLTTFIADGAAEVRRRVGGAYRSGYALAPASTAVGDRFEPVGKVVCRDPVWLPRATTEQQVVQVGAVSGIHSKRQRHGWWWAGDTAEVVDPLPYWVVFGPSGEVVVDLILATRELTDPVADKARSTVDARLLPALAAGDEWRQAVIAQVQDQVHVAVKGELARRVVGAHPEDATPSDDEMLDTSFARSTWRWDAAIAATVHAAVAAALVTELNADSIEHLVRDWQGMVGWERSPQVSTSGRIKRVVETARSPITFIDRHPTLGIVATVAIILSLFIVSPYLALALFAFLLLAAPLVVFRRRWVRRRRIRRRDWRPGRSGAKSSPQDLREAMSQLSACSSFVTESHLTWTLRDAEVHVVLDGPAPDDPARTIQWLRANAQPLPVAVHLHEDRMAVISFTQQPKPRRRSTQSQVWTTPVTFGDLCQRAIEVGATEIVVDPGLEPRMAIQSASFGLFVQHDHAVADVGDVGDEPPSADAMSG